MNRKNIEFATGIAMMLAVLVAMLFTVFYSGNSRVSADVQQGQQGHTLGRLEYNVLFSTTTNQTVYSTTTTATSTNIIGWFNSSGVKDDGTVLLAGAKQVNFYFGRTGVNGNQGSSAFQVQVTPNGTDWYYWDKWVENATSTINGAPLSNNTATIKVTGTSTITQGMVLTNDAYLKARCIANKTTDGENSCAATVQY